MKFAFDFIGQSSNSGVAHDNAWAMGFFLGLPLIFFFFVIVGTIVAPLGELARRVGLRRENERARQARQEPEHQSFEDDMSLPPRYLCDRHKAR